MASKLNKFKSNGKNFWFSSSSSLPPHSPPSSPPPPSGITVPGEP
jgi:hypothetical protein